MASDAQPFWSNVRGDQQRLANGNTLITESEGGRIFEVSPDGEIVWEFINPVRNDDGSSRLDPVLWNTDRSGLARAELSGADRTTWRNLMKFLAMATTTVLTLAATPAMAYVGPGAGLSLLGAFWGLLVAILAAMAFVIVYPVRRMMRARKRPAETMHSDQQPAKQ